MNEARFSNIFIEKRGFPYLHALRDKCVFFCGLTHKAQNTQNAKLIFLCKAAILTRLFHNLAK